MSSTPIESKDHVLQRGVMGRTASDQVRRILARWYMFVFCLIGGMIVVSLMMLFHLAQEQRQNSILLSTASAQRSLALETAFFSSQVFYATERKSAFIGKLLSSAHEMEKAQATLMKMDDPSETLKDFYTGTGGADKTIRDFIVLVRNYADDPHDRSLLDQVEKSAFGNVQDTLNKAFEIHQQDAERDIARFEYWHLFFMISVIMMIVVEVILIFLPLTQKIEYQAQTLEYESQHDGLTGMLNRAGFENRFEAMLTIRRRGNQMTGLILLDLDWFKELNETDGHAAGDAVLIEIADRLKTLFGSTNLVARLGGDEFAVVLSPLLDAEDLVDLAGHVRSALIKPIEWAGKEIRISATIGTSMCPQHGRTPEDLMRAADLALFEAKRLEKGTIRSFEIGQKTIIERHKTIRSSLDNDYGLDGLFIEFQPQMSLDRKKLYGFEALVRWDHPTLGRLEPDDFLKVAATCGRLPMLGRMVRTKAMQALADLRKLGLEAPRISINLAGADIARMDLLKSIESEIAESGLPYDAVELEITEEILLDRVTDKSRMALMDLHARGVHFSLDDFGTGFASLTHLRKMPIEAIKIDRSFILDIGVDPRAEEIARSMVGLAHSIGIKAIAEGIETEDQCNIMRDMGCDMAQGYYLARPMRYQSLVAWLRDRKDNPILF